MFHILSLMEAVNSLPFLTRDCKSKLWVVLVKSFFSISKLK